MRIEKEFIARSPFDGLRSASIWAWQFPYPMAPRNDVLEGPVRAHQPIPVESLWRSETMQGARSSGRLGVNPSRQLGQNGGCPPGYTRMQNGQCGFNTPPSAQFPQGYPSSAMVSPPVTGTTILVSRPSGMF